MKKTNANLKNKGFSLVELSIVLFIVSFMFIQQQKDSIRDQRLSQYKQTGKQVTAYTQAVAAYMTNNAGLIRDPAYVGEVHNGLGWLQEASCGGTSLVPYLSCNLSQLGHNLNPLVTISPAVGATPPSANINFGPAQRVAGTNDPLGASKILITVREQADVLNSGYIAPRPLIAPSATVIVDIDLTQVEIFVRTDGSTPLTIVNELQANDTITVKADDWSLITADSTGGLNSAPASNVGSLNVNDIYLRSVGVWASDLYNLALENYATSNEAKLMAEESIRFETLVSHGDVINKPACPVGLVPQTFISLATGISELIDAKSIAAFETKADDTGATWTVVLRFLTSDGVWHNIDSTKGYATARVKCSR